MDLITKISFRIQKSTDRNKEDKREKSIQRMKRDII